MRQAKQPSTSRPGCVSWCFIASMLQRRESCLTQCLIMFVGDASDKCLYLGVALPLGGRVVGRRDDRNHLAAKAQACASAIKSAGARFTALAASSKDQMPNTAFSVAKTPITSRERVECSSDTTSQITLLLGWDWSNPPIPNVTVLFTTVPLY